jgi:2-polyprenyl-6-methoxyphenol hydroxylase-like FAD-dependent oxidoreductase
MMRKTEVLIVGAGPTGLTLATLLARLGVRCIVIDKNTGPSTTSKALGLQYRVSELLTWMGLYERFEARAAVQTRVNLYDGNRRIARLALDLLEGRSGAGAFAPRPLILPQSETERLLGQALAEAGGTIEWGRELSDFVDGDDSVIAELADGERVEARYLVSCEGAHSIARKRANIAFDGKTYAHDFIMADLTMETELTRGEAHSWLHPDGVVSAITMPGERCWRLFIEAGSTAVDPVTLEAVRALYVERSGDRQSRLSNPSWLTRFKIHARMVERFRAGRVFLAGDAAHLHSPSGGQGITTGMQDAYNLGWKLAQVLRHGAPEALLDTYDEERRPAARAVLATTDRNTRVMFAEGPVGKWFRNHVFMPLFATRPVQRYVFGKLSQLDMGYRGSSLSSTRVRRRLAAGDRAPDVILSGGQALFDLLRAARFVALLTGDDAELAGMLGRLGIVARVIEADGELGRLYGARRGELWLIRPDGYIGLCCAASERAYVRDHLARFWSRASVAAAFARAPAPAPLASVESVRSSVG